MELARGLWDALPLWLAVPDTGFKVGGPVTRSAHKCQLKGSVHRGTSRRYPYIIDGCAPKKSFAIVAGPEVVVVIGKKEMNDAEGERLEDVRLEGYWNENKWNEECGDIVHPWGLWPAKRRGRQHIHRGGWRCRLSEQTMGNPQAMECGMCGMRKQRARAMCSFFHNGKSKEKNELRTAMNAGKCKSESKVCDC